MSTLLSSPKLYLLDTNVLVRLSERASPMHGQAKDACRTLAASGAILFITAQNLIEFWCVATRPIENNGLELTAAQAAKEIEKHKAAFGLLPDAANVLTIWEMLSLNYNVQGLQAHDARLAAVALAYQVPNFLTFNAKHFTRFAPEGLTIIEPATIAPPTKKSAKK